MLSGLSPRTQAVPFLIRQHFDVNGGALTSVLDTVRFGESREKLSVHGLQRFGRLFRLRTACECMRAIRGPSGTLWDIRERQRALGSRKAI